MNLFSNPELIRNARAQLRPGRMLAVAGICAAISLTMGYAFWESERTAAPGEWARSLLIVALMIQTLTLSIGGSLACLQNVSREKELNTFDFQRVTRLTPLELALGKLFGAPILSYFVSLCLLPLVLFAAFLGGTRPSFLLAALTVVLFGSITLHAVSLLISMLTARGSTVGGALLLITFLGVGSIGDFGVFSVGRLSPFFALDLVRLTSWAEASAGDVRLVDEFFGWKAHHFWMVLFIYAAFTAWSLAGLSRNLKRDPSTYELYSPRQSFGLALFINFLYIGFFRWEGKPAFESQSALLAFNSVLFFGLGLALVMNRDQVRRRVRSLGESASGWLAAAWPAPYLLAGVMLVGLLASALYSTSIHPSPKVSLEWDWTLALFRVLFVAAWLSRDVLYLQWVNVTRIKRPLVMGFVYLMVFYMCVSILLAVADPGPSTEWIAATLIPGGVIGLGLKSWTSYGATWMLALIFQFAFCGIFVFLQQRKLLELSSPGTPAAVPAD